MKKRVFSGTRATGRLHLGNYLGAVKGYIALQDNPEYDCVYMVVDLHAITTPYDHKALSEATRNIIIDYLAAGLDPEKSIITAQSLVPEHTYLAFLLSSMVTVARMQHLPTFKEKVKLHPDHITMALLNYAVLMAADILAYKAELVPAGVDQEPHLEVAREIARKMNAEYGLDFPETTRFATEGEYVPSILGEGKMSKTVEGSYINLTDDLSTIKKRLAAAPTDSGKGDIKSKVKSSRQRADRQKSKVKEKIFVSQGERSHGVGSLLQLVELFEGPNKRREYEDLYKSSEGIRYKELKEKLAEAIYRDLQPIQKKRKELEADSEYVDRVIREGAEKARKIASQTVNQVREKMGLL
jgi:tryptophanyl-tRNA synthetase